MIGMERTRPAESDRGEGGGPRRNGPVRMDTLVYLGLVALLIASTLNGLSLELGSVGIDITIRPDQVVLVCVAPLLVLAWARRRLRVRVILFDWVVLGFLLSNAVASLLFSPVRSASIKGTLLLTCYVAMYVAVRLVVANWGEWVRRASNWVVGLGVAQAAYSIIAVVLYSFGVGIGGLQFGHLSETSVATEGTFWEANLLGAYLALIAVILVVRYLFRSQPGHGQQYLLGLLTAGLALPLTMTRAAGIALTLGLFAIAVITLTYRNDVSEWKSRTGRVAATLGCVVLLSVTALNALLSAVSMDPDFLLRRWAPASWIAGRAAPTTETAPSPAPAVGAASPNARARRPGSSAGVTPAVVPQPMVEGEVERASFSSVDGRLVSWRLAFKEWRKRPVLGHGTLAGTGIIKEGWWYSSLVQALHDTGLVGFSLLLCIHVGAVLYPLRAWFRARQRPASEDLLAFALGNALLVFTSQFSSFFFVGFPWVLLGLSIGASEASSERLAPGHAA